MSDVQMQDETVNDAQQDVTTGEEVEERCGRRYTEIAGDERRKHRCNAEYNVTRRCDRSITLKKDGTGRIRFDYAAGRSDICSLSVEC